MNSMLTNRRFLALLIAGGLAVTSFTGCQRVEGQSGDSFAGDRAKDGRKEQPAAKDEARKEQFAEDRAPVDVKTVEFDAKRSMKYLEELCGIGPRISGSDGMKKQQELLKKHFEKYGATVTFQKFDGRQPSQKAPVPMVNLIVTWNPEAKRRVMFCGHYDTRPIADEEAREKDWRKPFLSANDGTATVAFMMELAHHMKDLPLKVGLDFVIFDAEEFINDRERDAFFLGSNYFADEYKKGKGEPKYIAAILLDLFAGKGARFPIEEHSLLFAGPLVEDVWTEAKRQKVNSFLFERGHSVRDDHLALNRVGIPAIDIIDFSYPHWHKLSDLPEHCSGDKMADVAKVLTAWVQRVK
jgi:hypothetical protein